MPARSRNDPAVGDDALAPGPALAHASALLTQRGFHEVARNARGDSLYLARGNDPGRLRLSNHARTPKQRRGHPEVLASLVIRQPRNLSQIAVMVEAALRDFAGVQRRRDQAATGKDSTIGA
ncbi:hypothetical protein OWC43_11930 [Methylorubrum sp. POS3]